MTKKATRVVAKCKQFCRNCPQEIDPKLKAWIDQVIVPILVRIWREASGVERAA